MSERTRLVDFLVSNCWYVEIQFVGCSLSQFTSILPNHTLVQLNFRDALYVHNKYMRLFKGLKTDDMSVYMSGMVDRMQDVTEEDQSALVPKEEQEQVNLAS